MIVHVNERFEKRLNSMRDAGGNAALAAGNAEQIIETLKREGPRGLQEAGRRTKYGERRLKNCIKFNLGNGYRLISIRNNNCIRLLFLGTHDECDAWLEKNRGRLSFAADADRGSSFVLPESAVMTGGQEEMKFQEIVELDEYEELLMSRIDDRMLRRLFSGLLKNSNE